MVYFLAFKNVGETYPDVDFVDFDLRQATTTDLRPGGAPIKPSGVRAFQAGIPIDPKHVPTVAKWASKRELYDYVTLVGSSVVSARMKEIIERFEPNVHQFFPLKVVDKKGEQIAEHFLWVVCNLIDSVDRVHTTLKLEHGLWNAENVENPRIVFSKDQIGGRHFWRDRHLLNRRLLCSDESGEALRAANLRALSLNHRETV